MKRMLFFSTTAGLLFAVMGAASGAVQLGISQSDDKALAFRSTPGIMLGNSLAWHPSARISLITELNLHYAQIALKEQRVWHYPGMLSLYDLTAKALYFEIPALLGYTLPLRGSWVQFYAGPSLHLCLSGVVQRTRIRVIADEQAWGGDTPLPDYDVSFIEDPGPDLALMNSAVGLNLGLWTRWSEWLIGFRYTCSRLHELDAVRLNSPFHTFSLMISFQPTGD